ncbi:ion transporter [Paucilactobacillus nenjiangensis]|jgi:voltage-gated potassium channel|uniref:ion transporter n=2 Tax=Paucilactobacillus nenjiangensis TaxID=1296540 RepID=UPI0010F6100D|nr:ion transporter [Paucilactobacillus nenjiangensis]
MNDKLKRYTIQMYHVVIVLLAMISIALVLLDYTDNLDIKQAPYSWIDWGILILFAIDYFVRLFLATNKRKFFRENIFDLLAIIPFDAFFSLFRLSRVMRVTHILRAMKLLRLLRVIGLTGKMQKNFSKFFNAHGLIYIFYSSLAIVFFAAVLYAVAENASLVDSLWWAIVTVTTVGYGDISPHTGVGRLAAILLMSLGIGFIGVLTSSITSYFAEETDQKDMDELMTELETIRKENSEIKQELTKLNQHLDAQKNANHKDD